MRNILLIARREYLEQIRGRAFKLSTIGLPAVLALVLASRIFPRLAWAGRNIWLSQPAILRWPTQFAHQLLMSKHSKAIVDVVAPATQQDRANLVEKVRTKAIDGILWIDAS
jgi:ABC-2 type transport system permease protein